VAYYSAFVCVKAALVVGELKQIVTWHFAVSGKEGLIGTGGCSGCWFFLSSRRFYIPFHVLVLLILHQLSICLVWLKNTQNLLATKSSLHQNFE